MRKKSHELARVTQRIAEVRRCIQEAQRHFGQSFDPSWIRTEREDILALLRTTLQALEAHKTVLERADR
jgi:hypothetical protein